MFLSRPSRRPVRRQVLPAARVTPAFESLEERRLFAAGNPAGHVELEGGKLDVEGTKKADVITIDLNTATNKIDVVVNGQPMGSFFPGQVTNIEVEARQGNDSVTIGAGITVAALVDGDTGNDSVVGGSGSDDLRGGPGKDSITGGAGDDSIIGESGNDTVAGGAGNDTIDGGAGKDSCSGDDGDDSVLGGSGNDSLSGDIGDDRLRGGSGKDSCSGGDGNDDIDGGSGRDSDTGGPGTDDFNQTSNSDRRGRLQDTITDQAEDESDDANNVAADQVPPAVTAAFTTRYPNATIHQIEREQEDSGVVYKFDFLTGKQEARAWFSETGQFIGDEAK